MATRLAPLGLARPAWWETAIAAALLLGLVASVASIANYPGHCGCANAAKCQLPCVGGGGGCCPDATPEGCPSGPPPTCHEEDR